MSDAEYNEGIEFLNKAFDEARKDNSTGQVFEDNLELIDSLIEYEKENFKWE